ncbi:MAG: helix-turn-helix domain-containing protein, partial [Dorea sp.]
IQIESKLKTAFLENKISTLVQKVLQYIHEYYNQGIKLEEIAQDLNVSEEYLSKQVRKETGKIFSAILREYKVEKVKKLLLGTSLKMHQIADMAGYSDAKYMSRDFKEEVGMLPSEYRKKNS